MSKVKKFLGWLTRLLLAAGAEKWRQGHVITFVDQAKKEITYEPAPYDPSKTAAKVAPNTYLVLLSVAGAALMDALAQPGILESLNLPEWAPIPVIYAALAWLRDRVRHG